MGDEEMLRDVPWWILGILRMSKKSWGKLWICVPSGSKDPSPSGCAVSWRPAGFAETRRIFSLPMAMPAEPWKYLLIERKRLDKWGYVNLMLHHVTSGNWWVEPLHDCPQLVSPDGNETIKWLTLLTMRTGWWDQSVQIWNQIPVHRC